MTNENEGMKILWLDLETSGLDPQKDVILEVACKLADFSNPFYADKLFDRVIQPTSELRMNEFVWKMHSKNGLLDALNVGIGTYSLAAAERCLLDLVPEIEDKEKRWILGGSTIHFDASFLRIHMPTLYSRLSYRLYDVTVLKLFCRSMGMPKLPKAEAHRAMQDIEESIAHAKLCADWLGEGASPTP